MNDSKTTSSVLELKGCLPKPSKALTLEEIDAEIQKAVLENDKATLTSSESQE